MKERMALLLPWLVLAFVTGTIVWDQLTPRETMILSGFGEEVSGTVRQGMAVEEAVARDVVCGMAIRKTTAYRITVAGADYFFCSKYCRDEAVAAPERWIEVEQPASSKAQGLGHTMRGIPSWMFQAGVGLIMVVSFGLFEVLSWRRGAVEGAVLGARLDLTTSPWTRRLIKWPPLRFIAQATMVGIFVLIIAAGLFGNQNPSLNITPLLTWTIWWAGLIFFVLYFGKLWCYFCPWDALATWLERLKLWGRRESGLGLGLRWPRPLRNIWPAVALFVLLVWLELGMGATKLPRVTAWLGLAMLALAVLSELLFDRKPFCRYGCLVGRVSGLYALFSSFELRSVNSNACADCETMDCYRGNEAGDGCPTFEFPRTMQQSTYCILCTECIKTCPHDNTSIRLRPWAADLAGEERPRWDEAVLAIILLSMTGFHGLTMTPRWTQWSSGVGATLGLSERLSFTLLMAGILVAPILFFWLLAMATATITRVHSTTTVFLRYAYALLPIALFYHLAHNAEHFLMEGPAVLALVSDPFGYGWDLFGTATMTFPPLVTLEGLWILQVFFVLTGHLYGLWICERITRRTIADRWHGFLGQLPMLAAMILSSFVSLWLLSQPMVMRLSAM